MSGKHARMVGTLDLAPIMTGKVECYVYPDQRPGKHDAGNFLGFTASNGMAYTMRSIDSGARVGAVLADEDHWRWSAGRAKPCLVCGQLTRRRKNNKPLHDECDD